MLLNLQKWLLKLAVIVGFRAAEYEWKWCGEPGQPKWELLFSHDGFSFRAQLAPSFGWPQNIGRFVTYAGIDTIKMGDNEFYLPARSVALLKSEFCDQGLSEAQADRATRRALEKEMVLADQYANGFWASYRMVVTIKRGRTELASQSFDEINMNPALLIFGGEPHLIEMALSLRASLCAAALAKLKHMASPVMRVN